MEEPRGHMEMVKKMNGKISMMNDESVATNNELNKFCSRNSFSFSIDKVLEGFKISLEDKYAMNIQIWPPLATTP
jgi:hypothetical protein